MTETGKRSDALNENGVSHGDAACDTAMIESDAADEEAKDTSEYEFRRMMKIQDNKLKESAMSAQNKQREHSQAGNIGSRCDSSLARSADISQWERVFLLCVRRSKGPRPSLRIMNPT